MASPRPFILPVGVQLSVGANSMAIRHDGDVVLEQTLGRRLARLEAGGDVTLGAEMSVGAVRAGGALEVLANVESEELRGTRIHLADGTTVAARAIVATEEIVIGKVGLDVDVIVAPKVTLDPAATGRVRVLDCTHELPATKVRGMLSLAEYESDFGGVADFLARRGVAPLSQLPEPRDETDQLPAINEPESHEPAQSAEGEDDADSTQQLEAMPATPRAARARRASPPSPSSEAPERPRAASRTAKQVGRAWERLLASYPEARPAAVDEMGQLVAAGNHDQVPESVDVFWRETLRHHLALGTPPPKAVILAFHAIRAASARAD